MTHQRGNAASSFLHNVSKVGQNRNPKQKQKKNPKLHFLCVCVSKLSFDFVSWSLL